MKTLFVLSGIGEILMLLALYWAGHKHVLAGLKAPYSGPRAPSRQARTAMIVPVTGDTPAIRQGLASLLAQDLPGLRFVFVTRDDQDPAAPLIRDLLQGRDNAEHVLGGQTTTCGQKNHNLLAGIERVRHWVDIYLFCDSSHLARPDLARLLTEPLAEGKAEMSGGFHRIVPLDGAVPTLGMLNVCLVLHSLQAIRAITQPWGGAMAVTRKTFEEHEVAEVWRTNIVDDFSLGPHLARRGIRTWPVALACLDTPLAAVPASLWQDWLTRQLLYLKFCTPEMWIGAAVVAWLFAAPPVLAALGVLGWLAGQADAWWLSATALYLCAFLATGLVYRTLLPRPVGLADWLKGFFVSPLMVVWCYLRTFPIFTMHWRGTSYRVTWGGRVVEVIRR